MTRALSVFTNLLSDMFLLSKSDQDALLSLDVTQREMPAGSYIVREGDVARTCSILISGIALRQKVSAFGHRQIVSLIIPGDALDLPNVFLGTADHDVRTLTKANIATVSAVELNELVQNLPALAGAILLAVLTEGSISREWILNLGQRDGQTRVAHFLCEYAARMNERGLSSGDVIDISMTQQQLGDVTGLTAVHVNRMLKLLEAEGLIVKMGRQLRIPRIAALRERADFNARYLHLPGREMTKN
ncbi:Crp/Fnr family transcriptional regulator [Sphingomonas faeni]|uniref:Crp/Fnr family transcriptional regulator n=1 Tax=Sphingomonas faeni TaxID=185950 RepID=UPI0020C0A79D